MSFIQENGGPLVVGAICLAIIGGYIEMRLPSDLEIQAKVNKAFVDVGAVAPHRMDSAEEDIKENEEDISDFEDRWNALIDALAATRVER